MTDSLAAWDNAIMALPTYSEFFEDLSSSTTNTGTPEEAGRWLLTFVGMFLQSHNQDHGPISSYDFVINDIEQLVTYWPMFRMAAKSIPTCQPDTLPMLARFLVERMPSIWEEESPWLPHTAPVTRAIVLADRVDTLVSMFSVGLKPNGSKDPFALRRAARHILLNIMPPLPIGKKKVT